CGKLKCNIDAAIFAELNRFGVRMCLRNDDGQFVKAKTRLMEDTLPAFEAEVMTPRHYM
ncbi:putative ribonuclease H protein, partial [Trifolium medium]|nr:putative ribonuclease H protein [Trifolium medium]